MAHTVLLLIAAVVTLLTWLLPAGQYDTLKYDASRNVFVREGAEQTTYSATTHTLDSLGLNAELDKFTSGVIFKPIGIPGSYHRTEPKPQGLMAMLQSPLKGITDAISVILFVLFLGGTLGVVQSTGAIDAGVVSLTRILKGKEYLLIIIVTSLMAAGGTTFGLAEETVAFYPILLPIFLAAGYDALLTVGAIYGGSSIGVLASTVNPFSTIIASDAAGISWVDGIGLRMVMLIGGSIISIVYFLRYAKKIKKEENANANSHSADLAVLAVRQKLILIIFAACFVVMIYGVSQLEWWFLEMSTLFFAGALVIGFISSLGERSFITAFIDGAKDLLSVALIIGLARGITILMQDGQIADTLLYRASQSVSGMPRGLFITVLTLLYSGLSLFIPSSSGMAVLTMPIFSPLADVVGIERSFIVDAYIFGQGLMGYVNPTGLILASLAIVKIDFGKWFKFILPLIGMLFLLAIVILLAGIYIF